jgi:hypothetical protein
MKRVVLGVLLAAAVAGCNSSDSCDQEPVSKRVTIETPTDPALQLRVSSCEVDVDACKALCELALERLNIATLGVASCKVGFAGARVLMDVEYTPSDGSCFFGGGDVAFANGGVK